MRRVHRIAGVALAVPFLVWTASGLLFLVKPGWSGAYEMLDGFQDAPVDASAVLPVRTVVRGVAAPERMLRADLRATALGPVYRIRARAEDGSAIDAIVDAHSGTVLSPLAIEDAERIAVDAASRARQADRYGAVTGREEDATHARIRFAGGAVVTVGREDLSVRQSGPDTDRIDALYRAHYLQWTGIETVDRVFAVAAIAATWLLTAVGLSLFFRRAA